MAAPRELDLDALLPQSAVLTFGGVKYPIPDALTVPMMARFFRVHSQLQSVDSVDATIAAMDEAHKAILDYIRLETPDANFQLDARLVGDVIAFLIGNKAGPAVEIADGLTDGAASDTEAISTELTEAGDSSGGESGGSPLPSARPSLTPSSPSVPSTGGLLGTGEVSSGGTSSSTSPTLSAS